MFLKEVVTFVKKFHLTRVRLKPEAGARARGDRVSFTSQGFVWNSSMNSWGFRTTALQSPKGSSETSTSWDVLVSLRVLQSHKGSSGTITVMAGDSTTAGASTPQGFVWNSPSTAGRRPCYSRFNPTRVRLEPRSPRRSEHGEFASTPQGFVWNDFPLLRGLPDSDASTPQGFVWNSVSTRNAETTTKLQPHKGSSGTKTRRLL